MVAFRCGLTADSRLHIAVVWEHGSLAKLCGLRRIKLLQSAHLCWLDTTLTRAWEWHGVLATNEALPPPPLPSSSSSSRIWKMWMGKVQIKQCGVMKCYCALCVLDSAVTRWCPVADWPSMGAFQAASSDRPCNNYRPVTSVLSCWTGHASDLLLCTTSSDLWALQ